MTSCLVLVPSAAAVSSLESDLEGAGIHVLGAVQRGNLVQDAVRLGPDVLVCHELSPDDAFFDAIQLMQAAAPRPVLLFTNDPDAHKLARALDVGIHAYVVN